MIRINAYISLSFYFKQQRSTDSPIPVVTRCPPPRPPTASLGTPLPPPATSKLAAATYHPSASSNLNRSASSLVNPIKVINLSTIQQKTLQEKLTTNKLNHKIIQINSASLPSSRPLPAPPSAADTVSPFSSSIAGNSVKITKVVSSRPNSFNSNNTHNVVYLNKSSMPGGGTAATDKPVFLANKSPGLR